jgi:hypothetical protein
LPFKYDPISAGIEVDEEVVLMTTKGEAIAIAIAQVQVAAFAATP